MKNSNFFMGALCAFLVFDGITAVLSDGSAWIGVIELLVAGFLSHPHLMGVWNSTGRAFFVALIKLIKIEKNEDVNG